MCLCYAPVGRHRSFSRGGRRADSCFPLLSRAAVCLASTQVHVAPPKTPKTPKGKGKDPFAEDSDVRVDGTEGLGKGPGRKECRLTRSAGSSILLGSSRRKAAAVPGRLPACHGCSLLDELKPDHQD